MNAPMFALFYILNAHGNVAAVSFDASTATDRATCVAQAQRSAAVLTGQSRGRYKVVGTCTTEDNLGGTLAVAAVLYTCEWNGEAAMACAARRGLR